MLSKIKKLLSKISNINIKKSIKPLVTFNIIVYSIISIQYFTIQEPQPFIFPTESKNFEFFRENISKKSTDFINVNLIYEGINSESIVIDYKLRDKTTTYSTILYDPKTIEEAYRLLEKKDFIIKRKIIDQKKDSWINNYSSIIKPIMDFLSLLLVMISVMLIFYWLEKRVISKTKYTVLEPNNVIGDWEDLIGMQDIKKEVKTIQPVLEKTLKETTDISIKTNMIFSGPPGTGKTKLASLLAKELNLPIIIASAADLETGFVNGGVKTLKSIVTTAEKHKKCIIFLDEAQDLFRPRLGTRRYDDDTTNALLAIVDGVRSKDNKDSHIIWILASNFDDSNTVVDPAMMRRFPFKVNFRLPSKEERETIFRHYIQKLPKDYIGNIDFEYLAEITSRMSPAIIENIISKCYLNAIQDNITIDTKLIIQNYEKEILGTTSEHQEGLEEQKKIIATHELGHFIVDYNFLMEKYNDIDEVEKHCKLLKISIENVNKIGALGFVLNKDDEMSLHGRKILEQEICKLYGGHAAEEVFFGEDEITTGAFNDIQKVTMLLKQMILEVPMYKKTKINYSMLENDEAIKNSINEIENKSSELYEKTINIIKKHRNLINYLLPTLLERNTLNSIDLFKKIKSFNTEIK